MIRMPIWSLERRDARPGRGRRHASERDLRQWGRMVALLAGLALITSCSSDDPGDGGGVGTTLPAGPTPTTLSPPP